MNKKHVSFANDYNLKVEVEQGRCVPVGKIAFKAASGNVVKVLITEPGLRPHGNNARDYLYAGKFRVRQVLVLDIMKKNGKRLKSTTSDHDGIYRVGKLFNPDYFTTDVDDDCGHGVHLFNNFKSAARLADWEGY